MFQRLFINHPQSVQETYLQHLAFAAGFSVLLLAAGFAAMIHAIIPALFETTASRIIAKLYHRTHNRGAEGSA